MYKVFFNESELLFKQKGEEFEAPSHMVCKDVVHFDDVVLILEEIEKLGLRQTIVLNCADFQKVHRGFNVVRSAGGLIQNKHSEWLFIKRMNRWDLPKGRIEEGESSEEAALREVEEECGIHGHTIVRSLCTGRHIFRSPYYPHPYNWVWKEADWFEMGYNGDELPIPQEEEDITEVQWFAKERLNVVYRSTYQNIKHLMDAFL
ncbi:MAG: NUDIX domain-containing protein [Mangrovibacterium sp.]